MRKNSTNVEDKKAKETLSLNFTDILYPRIAKRVKTARIKLGCPLDKFVIDTTSETKDYCWIDIHILNNIENGKTEKKRNPYLLSSAHIEALPSKLGMTKEELVWGSLEEQKQFARLILITVLCNASVINPFCYYDSYKELFVWAYQQKGLSAELRAYLFFAESLSKIEKISGETPITPADYPALTAEALKKKVDAFFENKYGFFYSRENYDAYDILKNGYNEELKALSNCLLNLMLHDYSLADGFIKRAVSHIHNKYFESDNFIDKMKELYANPSQYIKYAMDFKEFFYSDFVIAFDNLWKKKEKSFMDFFDKYIFKNDKVDEGLKCFKNEDFMAIVKSDELFQLCENASIIEEFTEPEAVLAHNIYQIFLQREVQYYIINQNSKQKKSNRNDILNYLVKGVNITEDFAKKCLSFQE